MSKFFRIHHCNLQGWAAEIFKVTINITTEVMQSVFETVRYRT